MIGRQREEYEMGWGVIIYRQPNLAHIEFRAKKALLPAEQRFEVLTEPEADNRRKMPRWE